jgi:acetyl-CoA carboxylase biotin carboxyl carrier protein
VPPAIGANQKEITSPIVGTFYRAPAPDQPVFVEVGARVSADDVVCIVEAMKVMNEIKAGVNGVVRKILVENATSVEYGQPMFLVEVG